jgi:hypothetical protein
MIYLMFLCRLGMGVRGVRGIRGLTISLSGLAALFV